MKSMRRIIFYILFFFASGLAISCAATAQDLVAGKAKAEVMCQTCHGSDGIATSAMVPNLAGQHADYTRIQLEAYRSGDRQHAQMGIISQSLSDEDMENLAAWYESIRIVVTIPE